MLQLSVVGYPFVNPGAVGGVRAPNLGAQGGSMSEQSEQHHQIISKENQTNCELKNLKNQTDSVCEIELYVRWYQLNTFLPILHFLKPPTAFPQDKVFTIYYAHCLKKVFTGFHLYAIKLPKLQPLWAWLGLVLLLLN